MNMNYNIITLLNKILVNLRINIYHFSIKKFLVQCFIFHVCFMFIKEFSCPIYSSSFINSSTLSMKKTFQAKPQTKIKDFVENIPILKLYGPLTLDINNIKFKSDFIFIPSLNELNKPIFLAINCEKSLINVKNPKGWKGWASPFFEYEIKIINQFCN